MVLDTIAGAYNYSFSLPAARALKSEENDIGQTAGTGGKGGGAIPPSLTHYNRFGTVAGQLRNTVVAAKAGSAAAAAV
jgi:hypothetical protein